MKFHLGQNEDCSPGSSVSDSPEELLRGGAGELGYIAVSTTKDKWQEHQDYC